MNKISAALSSSLILTVVLSSLLVKDINCFAPSSSCTNMNNNNNKPSPPPQQLITESCPTTIITTTELPLLLDHDNNGNNNKNEHESNELIITTTNAGSRRDFLLVSSLLFATSAGVTLTIPETSAYAATTDADKLKNKSEEVINYKEILDKASKKALGGGKAGASAAVVQVLSLMWLRTSMNYQYRYGGDLQSSLKTLYEEGGIPRFYQGLPFALVQGPLTRFGDTAANVGVLALLESIPETSSYPLPIKTACASVCAGLWRIFLMPVDTSKTVMQVEGPEGLSTLIDSVKQNGPGPLYQGAFASAAATAAGHYPWFLTYNFLGDTLPVVQKEDDLLLFLVRSAAMGLGASCVSDVVSNSLRVIKTTKQTASLDSTSSNKLSNKNEIGYKEALDLILQNDGWTGLFFRGLQTRLLTNAIQGAAFSVLWKYFQTI